MSDRYFVESPIANGRALLIGAEAHHLSHVMRAKAGARVTLFDGSGWEFSAVVERVGRSQVELAVEGGQAIDREAPLAVTLAVALPKGERQKWLVEKVVELGVARLIPLETDHGVAQPVASALERLRRGVIEASKQCGRNRLMEIAPPKAWDAFVAENEVADCRLLAHPAGHSIEKTCLRRPAAPRSVSVAVGPEGGFTEAEVALAIVHEWQPVSLGPRILRVETAAVALAAWTIGFAWERQD
jgi:16S rRNA (uracil1498-N3)-methyltransferase